MRIYSESLFITHQYPSHISTGEKGLVLKCLEQQIGNGTASPGPWDLDRSPRVLDLLEMTGRFTHKG